MLYAAPEKFVVGLDEIGHIQYIPDLLAVAINLYGPLQEVRDDEVRHPSLVLEPKLPCAKNATHSKGRCPHPVYMGVFLSVNVPDILARAIRRMAGEVYRHLLIYALDAVIYIPFLFLDQT